eukprot:1505297-Pyramimonas_sp.AAC.1
MPQLALADLQADGQAATDGFSAALVHMSGYSYVLVTFYGLAAVGLTGDNVQRFNRLGAFLSSLQLPRVAVGDYN